MQDPLEELLSRLREDRTLFLSGEEATRQGAVLPILAKLGWDRDNIREVIPEFTVGNGRVDYCLKLREKSAVFIEVKRTNQELENHQEQLLEYAFRDGVEIAVLTDGLVWWLYLPLIEGSWDQRKFITLDIQQQEVGKAATHFRDFLGRDAVASGSALQRAQELHASKKKLDLIAKAIPKAWSQLCQDPDEALLELLAERVESFCGHRPDQELLANFLTTTARPTEAERVDPSPTARPSRPAQLRSQPALIREGVYTNTKPVAYSFKGERHPVSSFKDILMGLCSLLHRDHTTDFERVLTLRGRKRPYFSKDFRSMFSPQKIAGTEIYAETNLSANSVIEMCSDVLKLFGYSRDQLQVEVQPR